jgi:uncharacterized delta-60 repeat protein/uncharacterized repeat protein (TIGR01451 family)
MFARTLVFSLTTLLILKSPDLIAAGSPGALDCSFGNAGAANLDLVSNEAAYDIARQSDGKLVTVNGSGGNVRLTRFSPGGTRDLTFGTGDGSVLHAFAGLSYVGDIEVDSQGRIVVAGITTQAGDSEVFVARFTGAGEIDLSFGGGDGWLSFDFDPATATSGTEFVGGMAIVSGDKIVVAGTMDPAGNGNSDLAVARMTSNGILDTTFGGGDGLAISGVANDDDGRGMAVDSLGRILVAGSAGSLAAPRNSIIARFSAAGVLDSTFNSSGSRIVDMTETGADDFGADVVVDNLDRALLYGSSGDDPAIARLTTTGALDTTFAVDGILQRSFVGGQDVVEHIFWQNDGRILVTGWPIVGGVFRFAAMRFTNAGVLDTTWGTGGVVTTAVAAHERAYAGLLQPNQRLVLAGGFLNDSNLGMVRFLNDNDAQTLTTVVSVGALPDPSTVGASVTVSANVAAASGGTAPIGKVIFSEGNSTCTATLTSIIGANAGGSCQLTLNTVGARTITAQYDGEMGFCRSAASIAHQVNLPATTTTLTSVNPNPSRVGETVEAIFAVTSSTPGTITGNVQVSDGIHSCTQSVQVGRCSMILASPGERTFTATYAGNSNFSASQSASLAHSVRLRVTPNAGGGGTISPAGEQLVVLNSTATFSVSVNAGFRLASISGCGGALVNTTFTTAPIANDCTISASFNQNPVATTGSLSLLEDSGNNAGQLIASDDGPISFALVSNAAKGQVVLTNTAGTYTYTPNADANGNDSFSFKVNDGGMDSNVAVVNLVITPVNDRPSVSFASAPAHAAISSGPRTFVNFAAFDAGPNDEDAGQGVSAYLIDSVVDANGVLLPGSVAISANDTLSYTLTGVGGVANVTARVRDNGGTANGGIDTSLPVIFTITVALGADLQIAIDNERSTLVAGANTLYKIVVSNSGPNSVAGARVQDTLPANLQNAMWTCRADISTTICPSPGSGVGNLDSLINLPVNGVIRFDLIATVSPMPGGFVSNTVSVTVPGSVTAVNPADDSAFDQDAVVPDGLLLNGFEDSQRLLTLPAANSAIRKD